MKYEVTTPRGRYVIESDSLDELRKSILKSEKITYVEQSKPSGSFIYLEQDDPKWGKVTIGNTPYELEDYGCLITSLSMLSYWYGKYSTPAELAKKLKFTSEGNLIWSSINDVLPFKFVYRHYDYDKDNIKNILFSADRSCVVRVFANKLKKSYHWMPIVGYDSKSDQFIGADPINGQRVFIRDKYGDINGYTELTRK